MSCMLKQFLCWRGLFASPIECCIFTIIKYLNGSTSADLRNDLIATDLRDFHDFKTPVDNALPIKSCYPINWLLTVD